MKIVLCEWGNFAVSSYFVMVLMAAFSAAIFFYILGRREGFRPTVLVDLLLLGIVAGLAGTKIVHLVSHLDWYQRMFEAGLWDLIWRHGYTSYGAIAGIALTFSLYLKMRKEPILPYFDLIALSAPIIILFLRIGCLFAGCCFGKPTDFFIHLTFSDPTTSVGKLYPGVPLHATQVYGMVKTVILFALLWWRWQHRKYVGQVTVYFCVFYSTLRFLIEFLRGDPDRMMFFSGTLTSAQLAMLFLFLAGFSLFAFQRRDR